jgi:hypothetical protein
LISTITEEANCTHSGASYTQVPGITCPSSLIPAASITATSIFP